MSNNDKQSDKKQSSAAHSSADNVAQHLRALGDDDTRETRYYSQEQAFSADELSSVINEARLNELLAQSDEFLNSLSGEIEDFDEEDDR
ncbi:hypothetical protein J3492_01020 [Psychrobacter sp. F1192]|uniref:Uncharacterized protein n=1 Tax=Psychrobacter coccoides TaxID=2818440 RepID=A0ABS3NK72_9GAMM|nr:hypothetical protein [Psychrobacter coccoides]MBO1529796.1 hypothetical protein [Psychrobacter coccoides]